MLKARAAAARKEREDLLIVARARDAAHAAHLFDAWHRRTIDGSAATPNLAAFQK
jgi:hypothetical protein